MGLEQDYGFTNVISPDRIVLDPSRVAAQIVTGIGFTGASVIFVHGETMADYGVPVGMS